MSYKLTEKAMLKGVEKMNSFGPRYTGSEAHRNYIDYLKKEAEKLITGKIDSSVEDAKDKLKSNTKDSLKNIKNLF